MEVFSYSCYLLVDNCLYLTLIQANIFLSFKHLTNRAKLPNAVCHLKANN